MQKRLYKCLNILFLIVALIGFTVDLNPNVRFIDSFLHNPMYLIVLIIVSLMFMKYETKSDKHQKKVIIVFTVIFSLLHLIGYGLYYYGSLDFILKCFGCFTKSILKFIFYCFIYYNILRIVYKYLSNKKLNDFKNIRLFDSSRKSFVLRAIIIFILFLPYFLHYYPGIFTTDSIVEMDSALNNIGSLVNHHPVAHIYLIALCLKVGSIFHSINIGIAIYSVLQMIVSSITFSYIIYFLDKQKVNNMFKAVIFVFLVLYPPFAAYSITMWKDVYFGLFLVFFIAQVYYMFNDGEYFKKKTNIVKMLLISILVVLFRNNGIYVVLISFIIYLIFAKVMRKPIFFLTSFILVFYIVFKGPVFGLLNITNGPTREALSVPIQQIARTYTLKNFELSDDVKDQIHTWIQNEDIENNYFIFISDNMKNTFNEELFKTQKMSFISLWFKLFLKYPSIYFESYFLGSMGYWYPEVRNWEISYDFNYEDNNILNYSKHSIVKIPILDSIAYRINEPKLSIFSLLFSIGFCFWILLLLLGYVIYSYKYKLIYMFIPILVLWLTATASPVWCEYRYVYGMFTSMPLFIGIICGVSNNVKKINH